VFSVPAPPPPLPSTFGHNQVTPLKQDNSKYKMVLTGFTRSEYDQLQDMIRDLGGKLVANPSEATHMISKKVVRTVKFLRGFSLCKYVLRADWIKDSAKQRRFLSEVGYVLEDPENESLLGMSVKASLEKRDRRGTKILSGYVFFITPSCLPSPKTIQDIVDSAGGRAVINKPASSAQVQQMQQLGLKYMIIACDNDLHICTKYFERKIDIVHVEFVFCAILKQTLDVEPFLLKSPNAIVSDSSHAPSSLTNHNSTPNHVNHLAAK